MPGLEQRDNFKGWLDPGLLRSMEDLKKRFINALQEGHEIEVTEFDQL
jgi:hypothetical protein